MAIYRITIPVGDYYEKKVFYQEIFFEKVSSPDMAEVSIWIDNMIYHCEEMMEDSVEQYRGWHVELKTWQDAKESINLLSEDERKSFHLGSTMSQNSTQIVHPRWGTVPITWQKINVTKLG